MTRRILAPLGALVTAIACTVPAAADDAAPPAIEAKSAIVVQPDTGAIVYARDASTRRPIASTTKLMTALLVLERLKLDDVVTAVPYVPSRGESVIYLRPGERLTVADLLRALLLPSANDAAATLADAVAGSEKAFVALMNRRAKELGLTDTHYENPIGLDSKRNYSSAADLVSLALELRRFQFFVETTNTPTLTLHSGSHVRELVNRNTLLNAEADVDGVKTGHTDRAGYVLVGSATRDGVAIVSAVLGEPDEVARDRDSLALLHYGLGLYSGVTAVAARRPYATARVKDQGDDRVTLVAATTVRRVVPRGEHGTVTTSVEAPDTVSGPLAAGSRLGTIKVLQGHRVVSRVALVAASAVPRASFGERTRAWLEGTAPAILLALLVSGSLTLVVLRRRALRRRPAEGAKAQ